MLQALFLVVCVNLAMADYNDTQSRLKFFSLSAGAYAHNPLPCLKNTFGEDVELVKIYTVLCDTIDTCSTYLALSHTDKAILIASRSFFDTTYPLAGLVREKRGGSLTLAQLVAEGFDSVLKPHITAFGNTAISEYFFNAFNQTWNAGLRRDVKQLSQKYWNYEIWISGHSLGGAIASLISTAISFEFPMTEYRITIITYGQPRIGDFAYALLHDLIVPKSYRVTHSKDLVVNLPPLIFSLFYHHGTEIFYDNNMAVNATFTVCEEDEDDDCSISKHGTSVKEHINYFGTSISRFKDRHCVWEAV